MIYMKNYILLKGKSITQNQVYFNLNVKYIFLNIVIFFINIKKFQ